MASVSSAWASWNRVEKPCNTCVSKNAASAPCVFSSFHDSFILHDSNRPYFLPHYPLKPCQGPPLHQSNCQLWAHQHRPSSESSSILFSPGWLLVLVYSKHVSFGYFLYAPTSRRMWNMQIVRNFHQFQIGSLAIWLLIYGIHMNILVIMKVKILKLIKWSHRSSQACWLLGILVSIFWGSTPIIFKHMSFWCPFFNPHLTTYHSNMGVHILAMLDFRYV